MLHSPHMVQGFWKNIKKPFLALAPMADVTDVAFRCMFAKYGKPDVMWTEFVSADGLCLAPEEGRKRLLKAFEYIEAERPVVAQIFGSNPEHIEKAVAVVRELGFDGVDLNMGCPDKTIEKQKAGAALIKTPELAKEIILAAKRGAGDMPVSVKTRIGYNKDELEAWLPILLSAEPALITIHARTRKEMSLVSANWERVRRAVEIRDEIQRDLKEKTLIAGNGDVTSREESFKRVEETGADGVMIGRGVFGNPWFFNPEIKKENLPVAEQLKVMVEHTKLFEELCSYKSFAVMKKHYKAYCHGFDGAKELRVKLMEAENSGEVEKLVNEFIKMAQ